MTRVAILSCAHMHVTSYVRDLRTREDVEVVGLYDEDPERGEAFSRREGIPWQPRMSDLLAQADAVVVGSENARHGDLVLGAIGARLPVLCEKPLATTLETGRRMVAVADAASVPLYMALPVRCVPAVRRLHEMVRGGAVGQPVALVGTNRGTMPPGWFVDPALAGGGAVMDHTPHVVDIMRWVLDSEVVSVYAEVSDRVHGTAVDDAAVVTLEFDNGVFATLDPSWSRPQGYPTWGDVTLEVVGTGGVIALDALAEHLHTYGPSGHRFLPYGDDMDHRLMDAFLAAVLSGEAPPELASGVDGLRALEVALAAYASAVRGETVAVAELL